jgi:hypothetical protein
VPKNVPFIEVKKMPAGQDGSLAIELAKHLQSRQYLGAAVVICADTHAMLSAVRKQWVKATRHLQSLRASTLNPEEILRLTHHVMHMQRMQFMAKAPQHKPNGHVYFVAPDELKDLPAKCASLYISEPCADDPLLTVVSGLSPDSLVIAYANTATLGGLRPKKELEQKVMQQWQRLQVFLDHLQIRSQQLVMGTAALDEALDTLLTRSSDFLHHAADLQHAISLTQPLTAFDSALQRQFEVIIRLAHRVQALSPGSFNSYLLRAFGDDEATSYFLRDGTFDI